MTHWSLRMHQSTGGSWELPVLGFRVSDHRAWITVGRSNWDMELELSWPEHRLHRVEVRGDQMVPTCADLILHPKPWNRSGDLDYVMLGV